MVRYVSMRLVQAVAALWAARDRSVAAIRTA